MLPMAGELIGWKNSMAFVPYGQRWRNMRKLSQQLLGTPGRVQVFHGHEEVETHKLLKRLLDSPQNLKAHLLKWVYIAILVNKLLQVLMVSFLFFPFLGQQVLSSLGSRMDMKYERGRIH
jgi:hypothetical protein